MSKLILKILESRLDEAGIANRHMGRIDTEDGEKYINGKNTSIPLHKDIERKISKLEHGEELKNPDGSVYHRHHAFVHLDDSKGRRIITVPHHKFNESLEESSDDYNHYASLASKESKIAEKYDTRDSHAVALEAHLHAAKNAPTIELKQKHIMHAIDHSN